MLRLKIIISALILTVPVIFSTNSFAFNMPKEFASLGTKSVSHSVLLHPRENNKVMENASRSENIKTALLTQYSKWKGTRYHWGGSSAKGIDCSALMQHIFNESLSMNLPRTTLQQIKNGVHVDKKALKVGDLVFFKTKPGVRHVGVYLGNKQFMHASTRKGVTISSLANKYWDNRYETARRLTLTEPAAGQERA